MGDSAKQAWIRTQKFGIELEVIGITRKQAAEAAQGVVGGTLEHVTGNHYDPWVVTDPQGRKWQFISDGSLSDAGFDYRVEMVTPPLTMADMETLQEIIRRLRQAGAKKSTHGGLHYVLCANMLRNGKAMCSIKGFLLQRAPHNIRPYNPLSHSRSALSVCQNGVSEDGGVIEWFTFSNAFRFISMSALA